MISQSSEAISGMSSKISQYLMLLSDDINIP